MNQSLSTWIHEMLVHLKMDRYFISDKNIDLQCREKDQLWKSKDIFCYLYYSHAICQATWQRCNIYYAIILFIALGLGYKLCTMKQSRMRPDLGDDSFSWKFKVLATQLDDAHFLLSGASIIQSLTKLSLNRFWYVFNYHEQILRGTYMYVKYAIAVEQGKA